MGARYTDGSPEAATSALDNYPEAVFELVPELRGLTLEGEPRADCRNCVMLPQHSGVSPEHPWAFNPNTKCCTFHPNLPNFMVGQALERGGDSERVVRARIRQRTGVSPWGIRAGAEFEDRYKAKQDGGFGRLEELTCPYWVGGEFGCGIWRDRNSVCRTWFCKYERGRRGRNHWRAVQIALSGAEYLIGRYLVKVGRPPRLNAKVGRWVKWYRWCADRARRLTPEEVRRLDHPNMDERRERITKTRDPELPPIPDVVVTSVSLARPADDGVQVQGYSAFDGIQLPRSIFLFFSKLDGERTWRKALAETNEEGDEPLTEAQVLELYRIGGIRSPEPGDLPGDDPDTPTLFRNEEGDLVLRMMGH